MTIEAPAEERAQALQQGLGTEAVSAWHVRLDLDALNRFTAPDGSLVTLRPETPLAGNLLDLQIPGRDLPLRLLLDTVYEGHDGVINYAGVIEGDDGSLVAISVDGRNILGKIHHSEGYTYLIESHRGHGGHTLSIIDQTLIPRPRHKHDEDRRHVHDDQGVAQSDPQADEQITLSASASGNVRLLVLYTPAVANQTDVQLMANNIVSFFNQSLQESGVDSSNYVTLAEVRLIEDNLATFGARCNNQILNNMALRSDAFTHLDAWMEVAYADIALAIVTTEPSYTECEYEQYGRLGGAAWLIPPVTYPDHPRPFSNTTHTYALGDLTAIHEIGHVLNGLHEYDCQDGTIPSYACGYAPSHCDWQTMMGGYGQCGFDWGVDPGQQSTVRIARWSNPNVTYNDEPTGVAGSQPHEPPVRHMAQALNENMPKAANWKGVQATPPSAPDPISASYSGCGGANSVHWTAQSGTVEYRLFRSSSPGFTDPVLMYSGPDTSTTIIVQQTSYVRVKACNSGGCSPYSSQVIAEYHNYCT